MIRNSSSTFYSISQLLEGCSAGTPWRTITRCQQGLARKACLVAAEKRLACHVDSGNFSEGGSVVYTAQ
jgi:hypothetical protein